MTEEQDVPPERWPCNFRDLPDNPTAWQVALMWIAEGLTEWGNDMADTEQILLNAFAERERDSR